ncbi:glycosyltransferase [Inquilinus sp. KBS0705]|nr:glycosyltransferase [Inquilinus sp. KBS0705]
MKILQINASYKPAYIYGGPTMSVSKLSEELLKAGHKVEVFTTTANGLDELSVSINQPVIVDGVTVTYFTRVTKDHTHFSPSLLKTLWKRVNEFDIVHIHAWWNLVSVLSCAIALKKGAPVVLSPRGTLSNYSFGYRNIGSKQLLHRLVGKRLLSKCHIHTTSLAESEQVSQLIKPVSITTIPNFVKLAEIPHSEQPIDGAFKLLFFSRIDEKKGLDILLNALKNITIPYHLTIAGDGDKAYIDELKKLATANGVDKHITWAGFYNDDKFDMLQQHQLKILPSHNENFGNVVIESLSVGTAVLLSKHVGLAHYIIENKLGWIGDTDAALLGQKITDIAVNHQTDLERIRATAPAIIHHDFNDDEIVKKYINLYQTITQNV